MNLRKDADYIMKAAIEACLPDEAVRSALQTRDFKRGRIFMVSVGKAAWQMAKAAAELITSTLRYPDGTPVQCVINEGTIGGGAVWVYRPSSVPPFSENGSVPY